MFSKACEYAIRSSIYLAEQSVEGRKCSLKETATSIASPEAFTAKILQKLKQNKLLSSDKGPGGGFFLSEQLLDSLRLKDIVFAVDGDQIYKGCGLGLKDCNEREPCPMHDHFKQIREDISEMLDTKVMTLANGLKSIPTFLKNKTT